MSESCRRSKSQPERDGVESVLFPFSKGGERKEVPVYRSGTQLALPTICHIMSFWKRNRCLSLPSAYGISVSGQRNMTAFGTFIALLLLTLAIVHQTRRYLRLRHVPTPSSAAPFTDAWRWYLMNVRGYGERMVKLHRKHGPLIRLGPNRVSTSDASMIHGIFGTNPIWEKVVNMRILS